MFLVREVTFCYVNLTFLSIPSVNAEKQSIVTFCSDKEKAATWIHASQENKENDYQNFWCDSELLLITLYILLCS